jgi:hypothetical protein
VTSRDEIFGKRKAQGCGNFARAFNTGADFVVPAVLDHGLVFGLSGRGYCSVELVGIWLAVRNVTGGTAWRWLRGGGVVAIVIAEGCSTEEGAVALVGRVLIGAGGGMVFRARRAVLIHSVHMAWSR